MNEADSDHVVLENIQRRIKTKIWSAQLSSFNFFLTHKVKALILLYCALCGRQLI